jgi:autotransporter family porin
MANYTWTGAGDGTSWNDPTNWDNETTGDSPATSAPGGGDDATIDGATITDSGSAANIYADGGLEVVGSLTAIGDVIAEGDVSVIGSLTALANIENDASMTVNGGTVEATEDITDDGDIEIQSGSVTATYDIDDIGSITLEAGSLTAEHDIFGNGSIDIQGGDVEVGEDIQSQGGSIDVESGTVDVGQDISLQGGSLELESGTVEAGQDIQVEGGSIEIKDGSITADNDLDNSGTITVDGSDSTLTVTNFFDDEMSLSITDGATVEAKELTVEDTADIDNGTLTTTGYLNVNGGTLTATDGSTIEASSDSASTATVTARGGGSIEISGGTSLDATGPGGGVIGYQGQGSLDIDGGSSVTFESDGSVAASLGIGYMSGDGTVTVDGGSSLTASGGTVEVDSDSTSQGELDLEGGSTADFTSTEAEPLSVGYGGTGDVVVAGGASLTASGGTTTIGDDSGLGSMEISEGSSAQFMSPDPGESSIIIGNDGATGTVSVDGDGSTLVAQEQLTVGNASGTGSIEITDGAMVTASSSDEQDDSAIIIGDNANGDVTVDGSGSTLQTDTGNVAVGAYGGDGTLTIEDSGSASFTTSDPSVNALYVGSDAGSQGTVTVDGNGSTLTATGGGAVIGLGGGTGTVTVSDGATADMSSSDADTSYALVAGLDSGSSGTLTVDGSGSIVTAGAGGVSIGNSGSGTVTVSGGGEFDVTDDTYGLDIATFDNSSGDVDVKGTDSTLEVTGPTTVGDSGTGTLTIEDGGSFNSTYSGGPAVDVGLNDGGDGTFTVDGDTTNIMLDSGDGIIVGDAGTGGLAIQNGASLEVSSTDPAGSWAVDVGSETTGDGTVSVDGAGSTLTVGDGGLSIGDNGAGYATISDGGTLDLTGTNTWVELGFGSGSDGTLTVEGSNTSITLDGNESLFVGDAGTGDLEIKDGATLDVASSNPEGYFAMVLGNQVTGDGTATVDGAGSTLTIGDGGLSVGEAGQGSLTVSDGAALDIADETYGLQIGSDANANGDIDITGDDSSLDSDGPIVVGLAGTGTLTVEDGGTLTVSNDSFISIGSQEGSDGTLTIDGDTSTFAFGGALTIGDAGTGTFELDDGATWEAQGDITIGAQDTGDGTLNVMGENSALTVDGTLTVGQDGTGTVNVDATDSADLITYVLMTAAGAQAVANVNIGSGNGSQANVTVMDTTTIGQDGTATITVDGGGGGDVSLKTSSLIIGANEDSVGDLDIGADDGGEASVDVTDDMTIGDDGDATVTLGGMGAGDPGDLTTYVLMTSAGAQAVSNFSIGKTGSTGTSLTVSSDMTIAGEGKSTVDMKSGTATVGGDLKLGEGDEASGTLSLSGDGTAFETSGETTVGDGGTGELDVDDGAGFTADGDMTLGDQDGSSGTLNIDGDGSSVDPPDVTVGSAGSGTVTISDGGSLETGDLTLGDEDSGDGTVSVADADSSLTVDGDLQVGNAGQGLLVVDGDTSVAGGTEVGAENGGSGQITVNIATLELDGETTIGKAGSGQILVQLGGTLTAHEVTLGDELGSDGTLTIEGDGTTATTDELTVGSGGQGTLNVSDGAMLMSGDDSTLGDLVSANVASATIDTQAYWGITGSLTVGGSGDAMMSIASGGNVAASADVVIGDQGAATGDVDVTGVSADGSGPSGLGFGGKLTVGGSGTGSLTIEKGALVAPTPGGDGVIEIAAAGKSHGTLTVEGAGSVLEGASLAVGGTDKAAGGAGALTIAEGASVEVGDVTVWSSGGIGMTGGLLVTDPITVETGGSISGYGTIDGDISNDGSITAASGTLALSDALSGSGTSTIDAGSELDVEDVGTGVSIGFAAAASQETLSIGDIADFHATVSDFLAGDKIDLAGLKYQSSDHVDLLSDNKLQITDQSGVYDIQLDPSQDFASDYFHLAADSSGTGSDISEDTQPCYCPGTLITTDKGDVPVEALTIDDHVLTHAGELRPIKWIGRRSYGSRFVMGRKDILPVRIKAGALGRDASGESLPRRDLWISPHHAMYLEGVLIEAKDLLNGVSIVQTEQVEADQACEVTYIHIELDSHDVILAEGAWSETFLDENNRGMFHNAGDYQALYPQPQTDLPTHARYYAPRLDGGFAAERIRQNIAAIAGIAAQPETTGPLRGFIDLIDTHSVQGWAQDCDHPDVPVCLAIHEGETLLGHVLAGGYRADLAQAGVGNGHHAFVFRLQARKASASSNIITTRALDGARLAMSETAHAALTSKSRLKLKAHVTPGARRAILRDAHRKRRTLGITMSDALTLAWAAFKSQTQTPSAAFATLTERAA